MPNEAGPITIQVDDSSTSGAVMVLTLERTTTGTPANDIGALLSFNTENSSPSVVAAADIAGILTDKTASSEKSALLFRTRSAGALTERWRITDTGILESSGAQKIQSSSGAFTIQPAGNTLFATTSGNVAIGTTSPESLFHIRDGSGGNQFRLGTNSGSETYLDIIKSSTTGAPQINALTNGAGGSALALNVTGGNVGIGTSSPLRTLVVSKTGGVDMALYSPTSGSAMMRVEGYNSNTNVILSSGGGGNIQLFNHDTTANALIGVLDFLDPSENLVCRIAGISVSDANNEAELAFVTRPSGGSLAERLRIDSDGNVGIGTTDPGAKLSIAGGAAGVDTEQIRFNRTEDGLRYNSIYNKPSSSAGVPSEMSFRLSDGITTTSQATVLTMVGSGNVGIGTTSPSSRLHVVKDASAGTELLAIENSSTAENTTKFAGLAFRGTANTGGTVKDTAYIRACPDGANYDSAYLRFYTRSGDAIGSSSWRWEITSQGILQSNGAQTIRTDTGDLTIATAAANGNIILAPHGTGLVYASKSACDGLDALAVENSSAGDCTTKFAGIVFRGHDTGTTGKNSAYLRTYPRTSDYSNARLSLWTRFSDSIMAERVAVGVVKTLTDAATSLFEIALPAGAMSGGTIIATIEASDGTDHQAFTQVITFAAVNKAGAYTTQVTVNTSNDAKAVSAGTLTAAWSFANGTNKVTMQVTPSGSLTETTYRVSYTVFNHSPQGLTFL
jgi:hypothetical protein